MEEAIEERMGEAMEVRMVKRTKGRITLMFVVMALLLAHFEDFETHFLSTQKIL